MATTISSLRWAAVVTLAVLACAPDQERIETVSPLCIQLASGANGKELFKNAVVATANVRESLIFGGMDPGTLEPIDFELGFLLNGLNVPLTAPADLYVRSIESTHYLTGGRAGETDYSIAFHVCSDDTTGKKLPSVEGEFAHITSLAPDLKALLDQGGLECTTNTGADESSEACAKYFEPDVKTGLVIAAGANVGSGGGTGLTGYTPGFDFNLMDTRFPIATVNPDRIGSETGQGRWFRYGACVYEYFPEPYKTAYLSKVGLSGTFRNPSGDPCGRLQVDLAGTAAGVWMLAEKAGLKIDDNLVEVLQGLLVLAPHPILVGQKEVISTEMLEIASTASHGVLVQFDQQDTGDNNVSFYAMAPGPMYCISGDGFQYGDTFHYYVQLGPNGDTLKIERLGSSCLGVAQGSRAFSSAAFNFVR